MSSTTSRSKLSIFAFVILITVVFVIVVIVTHHNVTAPYPGHNDFMSRWEGARSYWIDGLNPYGEQASLNIQERIYGRPASLNEDPGFFAYPFYTVFIIAPLVLTDYAWASAFWMVLLEACLIGALVLQLNLLRWKPTPILLGVLLIYSIFDYFAWRGLVLGQPGLLVYALEIIAIWAYFRNRDALGGVALALSTLKPQMGFLIVPLLLLIALRYRRWRLVGAFAVTFGILAGAAFILQPSWLGDWLAQVGNYSSYTALGSPVWIITQYYLGLGTAGEWALNLPLIALMLWGWYAVIIQRKSERLLWTIALTLTVTHLIAPRTATPHYVVFMLPILFYLRGFAMHRQTLIAVVIPVGILVITWVHFLNTVQGEFEHPTVYLPLPFAILILLIITRKRWWSFTP